MLAGLRRTAVSLSCLMLLVLLVSPARGQGTQGMLPEPITTRQLIDYAERLGLSPSQMTAIEAAHDEYKGDFRALRDGEIAEFMAMAAGMGGGMPAREQLEEMIETMEKLQGKIERLDDRLFDRLLPMLTDDQIARLPRIRLLRERQRLIESGQQAVAMSGRALVDVSELVHELDLEGAAIVDPALETYERRLTSDLEKLMKATFRSYLDMIDGLAAAGLDDVDFMDPETDPEEMKRFQEAMQQIWMDLQAKLRDQTRDIVKLERSTFTNVAGMLPPRDARRFRTEYYLKAYPTVRFALPVDDTAWLVRAIDDERLDEATREAMSPAVGEYLLKLDAIVAKAVELSDARFDHMNPFNPDMDRMRELQDKLRALQEQVAGHRGTLDAALVESLGAEELARTRKIVGAIAADGAPPTGTPAEDIEQQEEVASYDPYVASRLGRRDVRAIADDLGLEEGERAVLESLHADYVAAYDGLVALEELMNARVSLWTYDESEGVAHPPTDEKIDRLYELRRRAMEAVRTTDEAFFEEIKLLVPAAKRPLVDRLRGRRERAIAPATGVGWMSAQVNLPGAMDLTPIVAAAEMSPEEREAIDPVLARYEAEALSAHRARVEAALALSRMDEKWNMQVRRLQESGEQIDWSDYQKMLATDSSRTREVLERIAALNRETLEAMRPHLSVDRFHGLERTFVRAAHPAVFEDPLSVEAHLTKALDLDDLTPRQRTDLQELGASYRPAYETLSFRMVELNALTPDFTNWDQENWQKYQKQQSELSKVKYDRDEKSFRAARGLRTILDEHQLRRIGGLPEPDEER